MTDSLEQQLARISKRLQPKINEIMQKDVYEEVETVARKHVKDDVYDVYKPVVYDRKNLLSSSWGMEKTSDGIAVFNTRVGEDDKYIPKVIETGEGYSFPLSERGWKKKVNQDGSRPFIENTREEIRTSGRVEEILERGLKQKGIKVVKGD